MDTGVRDLEVAFFKANSTWFNDIWSKNLSNRLIYASLNTHNLGMILQLKVAEHSFSARFCWCKLARAQGFQKTNMPSTERSFYLLDTRTICVIFSIIACSVLMAVVF